MAKKNKTVSDYNLEYNPYGDNNPYNQLRLDAQPKNTTPATSGGIQPFSVARPIVTDAQDAFKAVNEQPTEPTKRQTRTAKALDAIFPLLNIAGRTVGVGMGGNAINMPQNPNMLQRIVASNKAAKEKYEKGLLDAMAKDKAEENRLYQDAFNLAKFKDTRDRAIAAQEQSSELAQQQFKRQLEKDKAAAELSEKRFKAEQDYKEKRLKQFDTANAISARKKADSGNDEDINTRTFYLNDNNDKVDLSETKRNELFNLVKGEIDKIDKGILMQEGYILTAKSGKGYSKAERDAYIQEAIMVYPELLIDAMKKIGVYIDPEETKKNIDTQQKEGVSFYDFLNSKKTERDNKYKGFEIP